MSAKRAKKSGSAGNRQTDSRRHGSRPTGRRDERTLARAGTRASGGSGAGAILGWSAIFLVVAAVVVGAAIIISQNSGSSGSGSGTVTAPVVVTPSNIASEGRTLGNADAKVTVDFYGDFRCTACHEFTLTTEVNLVNDYMATGKAKLVWNDRLVIDDIRQETASLAAANAAFCAADQGKFWTMHDWLFANQASDESASAFSPSRLSEIGKQAGLDMTTYLPCLNSGTHDATISAASTAVSKTITGTPAIYVDGKFVGQVGSIPSYDEIKAAIDAALAAPAPTATPVPTSTPVPGPTPVASPS